MRTDDYILKAIVEAEKNELLHWKKRLGTNQFIAEIVDVVEGKSMNSSVWEITYDKYETSGNQRIGRETISIPKPDIEIDKSFINKKYNVVVSLSFTYKIEGVQ